MTDGMLLAELAGDRRLERYDTIIIDEAHERSVNIDFLLGLVRQLMDRRPELRVVITSATIDAGQFSEHFSDAPIIEVPGRTYPVDIQYWDQPPPQGDMEALAAAVVHATKRIETTIGGQGDVLVFLPGEREIRECMRRLEGAFPNREVLPLHARLSLAAQERVVAASKTRRIICSTNVAETSLTVPSVRGVIDSGLVRVGRWSARRRLQRLPIEDVCQASAVQRAGRAGRVAAGACIRLYSQCHFDDRPAELDPEIRRCDLAGVLLRMAAMELGDPETFPFLDPLRPTSVRGARRHLEDLGAMAQDAITPMGREMAALPLEPSVARVLLAAGQSGCLEQVSVIAAVMGLADPRLRPTGEESAADIAHRRLLPRGCESDFMALLALWDRCIQRWREHGASATRRWCRDHFVSWVRLLEWRDIHSQLRRALREPGILAHRSSSPRPNPIHRALLAGVVMQVGRRIDDGQYETPSGRRFRIHPSSVLATKSPPWVMAGELVETSRLWGRTCATVQPGWIVRVASHLVRREYDTPQWNARRGCVMAKERITLRGLTVSNDRRVNLEPIDPEAARQCFINQVLVDSDDDFGIPELATARNSRRVIMQVEDRLRRRTVLRGPIDRQTLWDARLPQEVIGLRSLQNWWRHADATSRSALALTIDDLASEPVQLVKHDFPEQLDLGGQLLPVRYRFAQGEPDDGVTIRLPLVYLEQIDDRELRWRIPGMRRACIDTIVSHLPKDVRRGLSPRSETIAAASEMMESVTKDFDATLAQWLSRRAGTLIEPTQFSRMDFPEYFSIRWEILSDGHVIASGRDLGRLRRELAGTLASQVASAQLSHSAASRGHVEWDWESLSSDETLHIGGQTIAASAFLVDAVSAVDVQVAPPSRACDASHRSGVYRLAIFSMHGELSAAIESAMDIDHMRVISAPRGLSNRVWSQAAMMTLTAAGFDGSGVRDRRAFESACTAAWGDLASAAVAACSLLQSCWDSVSAVDLRLEHSQSPCCSEVNAQVSRVLRLLDVPMATSWLARIPVWLGCAATRLSRASEEDQSARAWEPYVDGSNAVDDPVSASGAQMMCLLEEWRCGRHGVAASVQVDEAMLRQQAQAVARDRVGGAGGA
jgi:ATP-dependent helicase HrpA